MILTKRLIIVRRGATDVYERLRTQFAGDPETVVIYDRRLGSRRRNGQTAPGQLERRRGERRLPHDFQILDLRGFYAIRPRPQTKRKASDATT